MSQSMVSNSIKELIARFPKLDVKRNYNLANQTYFKIGGPAEAYVEIDSAETLSELISYCTQHHVPVTFFGGGSNIIVDDAGVKGLVIKITHSKFEVQQTDPATSKTQIAVGAGLQTALLVRKVIDAGFQGLEYFLGVPGSVGGAVYNNAHYLEDLIGEFVHAVKVITPSGDLLNLSQEECRFGYDRSRFQETNEVIYEVVFGLEKGSKEASLEKVKKATVYRAKTQPLGEPSSGCIFQNVPNNQHLRMQFPEFAEKQFVPGGFLIDQAGLKGTQIGDIAVSVKHAAFFVNKGKGSSEDVKALVKLVKDSVLKQFGVQLEEEVFYIGGTSSQQRDSKETHE